MSLCVCVEGSRRHEESAFFLRGRGRRFRVCWWVEEWRTCSMLFDLILKIVRDTRRCTSFHMDGRGRIKRSLQHLFFLVCVPSSASIVATAISEAVASSMLAVVRHPYTEAHRTYPCPFSVVHAHACPCGAERSSKRTLPLSPERTEPFLFDCSFVGASHRRLLRVCDCDWIPFIHYQSQLSDFGGGG